MGHDDLDTSSALSGIDVAVLVGYFMLVGLVSLIVGRHQSKSSSKKETETYFLAERSVSWWAVAASLFASNVGAEHFVGLAGSAARLGVAVGWYEVGAIPCVIFTGLFFLPIYLNAAIQTTPDYVEKRYNLYCRTMIVCVSLGLYVFSKLSATLFAGELILVHLIHVNKTVSVILLVLFTALYTLMGGLEAVIYTEALQTVVLLIGGFLVTTFSLRAVGGWETLVQDVEEMDGIPDRFLHFSRPADDEHYPWTGFLFGFYVVAPWYWGIDQVIVQRALAARNVAHGQLGCSVASAFKFVPGLIMILPGLCGRILIQRLIDSGSLASTFNYDTIYPWLVVNVIPKNLRGIIVASMLSSLMSALASVFNSAATLFSLNIYSQIYKESSEKELVFVGRVIIVVLAILALLWLPLMPLLGDSLFLIIQKPPAYVAPSILCIYLWGMLSRFPTRKAGSWTLTFGIGVGTLRFVLEIVEDVWDSKMFGPFTSIHFLHFSALSFWINTICLFFLSMIFRTTSKYVSMGSSDDEDGMEDFGDITYEYKKQQQDVDKTLLFRRHLYSDLMRTQQHHVKQVASDDLDFDSMVELTSTSTAPTDRERGETTDSTIDTDISLNELSLQNLGDAELNDVAVTRKHPDEDKNNHDVVDDDDDEDDDMEDRGLEEKETHAEEDELGSDQFQLVRSRSSEGLFDLEVLNHRSCVSKRTIYLVSGVVMCVWVLQVVSFW